MLEIPGARGFWSNFLEGSGRPPTSRRADILFHSEPASWNCRSSLSATACVKLNSSTETPWAEFFCSKTCDFSIVDCTPQNESDGLCMARVRFRAKCYDIIFSDESRIRPLPIDWKSECVAVSLGLKTGNIWENPNILLRPIIFWIASLLSRN